MMHFKKLTKEENKLANLFLSNAEDYFRTINNEQLFLKFFTLFIEISSQREFDKNQLKIEFPEKNK